MEISQASGGDGGKSSSPPPGVTASSPYPSIPYPTTSSPYPLTSTPHQAISSPYPSTSSPEMACSSSHPTASTPYTLCPNSFAAPYELLTQSVAVVQDAALTEVVGGRRQEYHGEGTRGEEQKQYTTLTSRPAPPPSCLDMAALHDERRPDDVILSQVGVDVAMPAPGEEEGSPGAGHALLSHSAFGLVHNYSRAHYDHVPTPDPAFPPAVPSQGVRVEGRRVGMGDRGGMGRQRLRPWLQQQVDNGQCPGLEWLERSRGLFKVPWKHGGKQDWEEQSSLIFKLWAVHTGRYREGVDRPDWPTWKTRFRCALNKLPDIREERHLSKLEGSHPYRVYSFLPRSHDSTAYRSVRRKSSSSSCSSTGSSVSSRRSSVRINIPTTVTEHLPRSGEENREEALDADLMNIDAMDLIPFRQGRPPRQCKQEPRTPSPQYTVEDIRKRVPPPNVQLSSAVEAETQEAPPADDVKFGNGEPEEHELTLQLRYRDRVVHTAQVRDTRGCRLDYGSADRQLYIPPIREQIFGPERQRVLYPDPASVLNNGRQAATTASLLSHLERGLLLSTRNGDIYATRNCRLAVFVTDQTRPGQLIRLQRNFPDVKIFDFQEFQTALQLCVEGRGPRPSPCLTLGLGQRWNPGLSGPARLLLSASVLHRRAAFLLQKMTAEVPSLPPEISRSDDYDQFLAQYRTQGN